MIPFQPRSGNSSVVEHDLAKVGVASSNLVSRSILLLLFILSFLNSSDKFFIKKSYCVDNLQKVDSSLFTKDKKDSFFILNLPKNRTRYMVSSLKITSKFRLHDINITDLTNGVVIFKKCKIPINLKKIKMLLSEKFKERFPHIKIKSLSIFPFSPLSPKLSLFTIQRLDFKRDYLKRAVGTFGVWLKKGKITKQIYLKYNIDASIVVFKANYNLRNDKILQNDDYTKTRVKLDRLPYGILRGKLGGKYIVRGYIRRGMILSMNHFRVKKDILKGEYIKAILKDENLVLEIDAHLMNDANIGDTVSIKTDAGKIFKAKIVSSKTAMIME